MFISFSLILISHLRGFFSTLLQIFQRWPLKLSELPGQPVHFFSPWHQILPSSGMLLLTCYCNTLPSGLPSSRLELLQPSIHMHPEWSLWTAGSLIALHCWRPDSGFPPPQEPVQILQCKCRGHHGLTPASSPGFLELAPHTPDTMSCSWMSA